MSTKYDFEVYTSDTTSTGIVLGKIKRGSTILEFGCAAGRMTRYMKEELGCRVYIVEYEQDAFDIAMNYAEDGICDDIMNFSWVKKFEGVRFDSILFVDVLEHVFRPDEAVKKAKELLKDDGKIYISVPNITHNDVVIKACLEHFDYTKVGLLDDTHVHFWGAENIKDFASSCGMYVESLDATYCETGKTEQFDGKDVEADPSLVSVLRSRKCGEIYQFVFVLSCTETEFKDNIKKRAAYSKLYTDKGEGFSEENMISVASEYKSVSEFTVNFGFDADQTITAFRFDPIEGSKCILRNLFVTQGGNKLDVSCPDGIKIGESLFINSLDPLFSCNVDPAGGIVEISADVVISGYDYTDMLEKALAESSQTIKENEERLNNADQKIRAYADLVKKKEEMLISLENGRAADRKYVRKIKQHVKKILKK